MTPLYFTDDGEVDYAGTFKRTQYDNGSAAGSPPDFDGSAYGVKPAPYVEPARYLPRLGTPQPILVAGPGITPNAPKTGEGAPEYPAATKVAPSPLAPSGMPVLRAADTPPTSGPMTSRVDWRLVVVVSLVLGAILYFAVDRGEE